MAKTLQEEFIDLINAKNPDLGLTLADVDFGNPAPYTPGAEGGTRNTVLTLTAKASSPTFKGSQDYHFSRFNLTHPNGEDTYSLTTEDVYAYWLDDAYVLDKMNRNLPNHKLTLEQITVVRENTGTDDDGEWYDVKVVFDPNHLKWAGAFVFRIYDGKDNLMWKNGQLNGFN